MVSMVIKTAKFIILWNFYTFMRFIHHTVYHILFHLGLFSGLALLVPVMTKAIDEQTSPILLSPSVFFAGFMLVVISTFLLYLAKGNLQGLLKSLGTTMYISGTLTVLTGMLDIVHITNTATFTGSVVLSTLTEFYVHHSAPSVLSVAAVYLAIGGLMYRIGLKIENVKDRLSPMP